jgi:hypothetical protein
MLPLQFSLLKRCLASSHQSILLWVELYAPQTDVGGPTPTLVNVTKFGHRIFADPMSTFQRLEQAIIQYDWCPYKKRCGDVKAIWL